MPSISKSIKPKESEQSCVRVKLRRRTIPDMANRHDRLPRLEPLNRFRTLSRIMPATENSPKATTKPITNTKLVNNSPEVQLIRTRNETPASTYAGQRGFRPVAASRRKARAGGTWRNDANGGSAKPRS